METAMIASIDKRVYMNTFGERFPIAFTHGKDSTLYDKEGVAYTDFLAGIAVNALGYGHPKVTAAITEQAQKLLHCSNYFYIEQQALLAEMLTHLSCFDRAFFCNTGAEANEGAIKLARKHFYDKGEDRYEIIACDNSFHGRTIATVAATGQEKYKKPYAPLLPSGIKNVPYGDASALKSALSPKTAAVLIECIQGEGGVIDGSDYLAKVRALCDENGCLMIVDEVQTGIGRTGTLFAYEQYGFESDILTLAKALGGGVPIGAILAKEACCAFAPGDHGTTFGGNPLACAAGLAVLSEISREAFLESVRKKGEYFKAELERLQAQFPQKILEVRGRGLMLGMELAPEIKNSDVQKELLKQGFIIGVAGHNTLRFIPPLIIREEQIDALVGVLTNYFRKA